MAAQTCKFPSCNRPAAGEGDYCADHVTTGPAEALARQRHYDQDARDPEAKKFYNSQAWKAARAEKLTTNPVCERCERVFAQHVHHKIPLAECPEEQKTAQSNLMAVCQPCHNAIEAETTAVSEVLPFVSGMLEPVEDERFYFDSGAGEKPIRFIEKFCQHFEGRFVGKPFTLLDWQKKLIRTLFGWKHRAGILKDKRRFTALYLITAKGAGKTPLLTGIGLYMLLGDGEAGAHVISMASTFEQANLTFSAAKKYIAESRILSSHQGIEVQQHVIKGPRYASWNTISGKPTGRSGPRPSCVIADELHEWPAVTAQAFDTLCANLFKRDNPLLLMATNAGPDRTCYAFSVHERAIKVLAGLSNDTTLLPVIYEASREMNWRSAEAAAAANPSMGQIVQFEQVAPELEKGEPRYKRLYLSQWVTGVEKWLDMDLFDVCTAAIDGEAIKDAPLYVGLDMSEGDDLCAAALVYPTLSCMYVRLRFWLPRVTANLYKEKNGIPYPAWGERGAITLLDEPTISTAVQERIAAEIIGIHATQPITAVCYDRAYSSNTIAAVEAVEIECRKIGQGWGVSAGTAEVERRITERSMQFEPNPVMRFCAENAEIKTDPQGNRWPVKPMAKNRYAGRRSAKIDGVTALVTAVTEARKHLFAANNEQEWAGEVRIINL